MIRHIIAGVIAVCIWAQAAQSQELIYSKDLEGSRWHIDCYEHDNKFHACQAWVMWKAVPGYGDLGMSISLNGTIDRMSLVVLGTEAEIEKKPHRIGFAFHGKGAWPNMTALGVHVTGMQGYLVQGTTPYKLIDDMMDADTMSLMIDGEEKAVLSLRGSRVALTQLFQITMAYSGQKIFKGERNSKRGFSHGK